MSHESFLHMPGNFYKMLHGYCTTHGEAMETHWQYTRLPGSPLCQPSHCNPQMASLISCFKRINLLNKGYSGGPGEGSWQEQVTPHKLSHTNMWAYLTQGLTLLGNLCGLTAVMKEIAAATTQVS